MDGSVAFARLRQCAPPSSTLQSASAPYRCCRVLSGFEYIDIRHVRAGNVRVMSWVGPFSPSKLPHLVWESGPHPVHGSLGSAESISRTALRSVQETDRPCYSVCSNRPHLSKQKKIYSAPKTIVTKRWCLEQLNTFSIFSKRCPRTKD